jgi:hypothetical protein
VIFRVRIEGRAGTELAIDGYTAGHAADLYVLDLDYGEIRRNGLPTLRVAGPALHYRVTFLPVGRRKVEIIPDDEPEVMAPDEAPS